MGLLDFSDPNTASLLGAAQGLLAASGASRLPVTLGAAMGQGMSSAQQAQMSALQMRRQLLENQMLQTQLPMAEFKASLFSPQGAAPSGAPIAMGQGATAAPNQDISAGTPLAAPPPGMQFGPVSGGGSYNMGGVGPTVGNADALGSMPQQDPMASYLPPGVSRQQAVGSMIFPGLASSYALTNEMKNAYAAYGPSGAPSALRANIIKNNGGLVVNGDGTVGVATGYAPSMAGIAGAEAGAKAGAEFPYKVGENAVARGMAGIKLSPGETWSQNPMIDRFLGMVPNYGAPPQPGYGSPQTMPQPGSPQQPPPQSQPQPQPQPVAVSPGARAYQASRPSTLSGMDLGTAAGAKKAGADYVSDYHALTNSMMPTKQSVTGLENALDILNKGNINTGPGSSQKYAYEGVANAMGIPLNKQGVIDYQTAHKYLSNSLYGAASGSSGATGSDARFEGFFAGQPNTETMSPQALREAVRYVLSQQDAKLAQAQFVTSRVGQSNDPKVIQAAQQEWNKAYDPRYFEARRQDPIPSSDGAKVGKLYNTPKGVMRRVSGGWEPVNAPQ